MILFLVLGRYRCEPDEEITSVVPFTSSLENQEQHFFCLGTMIYNPEETEPSSGRLLIFTAFAGMTRTSTLELSMLASAEVNGCVFALSIVGNKIAAAVNSAVSRLVFLLCIQHLSQLRYCYTISILRRTTV
jgi:DNA damage-binding protein 1